MLLSGLLIVFGIPIVWLKPSLNVSESLQSNQTNNDTTRTKRQPEFYDLIHHLIEQHANYADQQLAPLKPFGNFKPFETFVYPQGFPKAEQQLVGGSHSSTCTQVKICPIQQEKQQQQPHTHAVSNHDPDVLNYMAKSKELEPIVVAKENPRIPPNITETNKNLSIFGNGYRLRNHNPRILYRKQQVGNRQIFSTVLQNQNFNKSIINGQNKITSKITKTQTPPLKTIEKSERIKGNVLASGGPANITCTCPDLLLTNNSSLNFTQNLNILVQELEGMANFNNQTEALPKNSTAVNSEDILRMLEKFKALQGSVANRTTMANRASSDGANNILTTNLTETTNSEPETTSNINYEETKLQKENFVSSVSPTRIKTNSTENLEILNSKNCIENADETTVQDSTMDSIKIDENEFGISGASAITLSPTDLVRIIDEMQNVNNDLNQKTHEYTTNMTEINEAETEVNANRYLQNTSALPYFRRSDNSSLTNSCTNITLTNNGSFKTIHIKQPSLESSKKNVKISKNRNTSTHKGIPHAKTLPSDMTGTSSRYIKYFRNLRQNASFTLSDESYAEPIVSEIYPAKMYKSPLSIYLHRIVDKSKISHDKPPSRNWRILKSGEYDNDKDDISTLTKDCDDYEDSAESQESQQQNKIIKPRFRELFT